jgi:hypothetical protein
VSGISLSKDGGTDLRPVGAVSALCADLTGRACRLGDGYKEMG